MVDFGIEVEGISEEEEAQILEAVSIHYDHPIQKIFYRAYSIDHNQPSYSHSDITVHARTLFGLPVLTAGVDVKGDGESFQVISITSLTD